MKKIVVIGTNPINFVSEFCAAIASEGQELQLISFKKPRFDEKDYAFEHMHYDGFEVSFTTKFIRSIVGILVLNFKFFSAFRSGVLNTPTKVFQYFYNYPLYTYLKDADVVNLQQVVVTDVLLAYIHCKSKFVLSFWGSDLYSKSRWNEKKNYIKRADVITMQTPEMELFFRENYEFSNSKKIEKVLFPLENSLFEHIDSSQRHEDGNIHVHIGYGGSESHQHLEVIKALQKIDESQLSNCLFHFKINYGGTKNYISELKNTLKASKLRYILHEEILPEPKLAQMRVDGDVFINVQKTDAFCASLSEALYAGNICLVGSWLPYSLYSENGVYIEKIGKIEEISTVFSDLLKNQRFKRGEAEKNRSKVLKTLAHSRNKETWKTLLTYVN